MCRFADNGDVLVSDPVTYEVRLVSASTGEVCTLAGTGNPGMQGDGSFATQAGLMYPGAVLSPTVGFYDPASIPFPRGSVFFPDAARIQAVRYCVIKTRTGMRMHGERPR